MASQQGKWGGTPLTNSDRHLGFLYLWYNQWQNGRTITVKYTPSPLFNVARSIFWFFCSVFVFNGIVHNYNYCNTPLARGGFYINLCDYSQKHVIDWSVPLIISTDCSEQGYFWYRWLYRYIFYSLTQPILKKNIFHVPQVSLSVFSWVTCFFHQLHTRMHMRPYYSSYIFANAAYLFLLCRERS